MSLATWGGKINALDPHDTAFAERESTVLLGWEVSGTNRKRTTSI